MTGMTASKDAATAEEATRAKATLDAFGRLLLDKAIDLKTKDPARAAAGLDVHAPGRG